MKVKRFCPSLISLCLLLFLIPALIVGQNSKPGKPPAKKKALVVRIGVITHDDPFKIFKDYEQKLQNYAKAKTNRLGRDVHFRLAVGSYSDVFNWYMKDSIDVAFLSPALVVEVRKAFRKEGKELLDKLYIASHSLNKAPAEPAFGYKAMCAVNRNSPIKNFEDLRAWAQQGRVNFHFIDPLSVSGRILPEFILRQQNINNIDIVPAKNPDPDKINNIVTWTYNPADTQDILNSVDESALRPDPTSSARAKVGCFYVQNLLPNIRKLEGFPLMDDTEIPQEVLLATESFKYKDELEELFNVNDRASYFQKLPDWQKKFEDVSLWSGTLNISPNDDLNQNVDLKEIGRVLRRYEKSTERLPRVALVLSGGGAKCAYQLGAIQAIETEISQLPRLSDGRKIDIDLVVGTSGGAINTLLTAMGRTRGGKGKETTDNYTALRGMWTSFDQRNFLHPWKKVTFALGVTVGFLEAFVALALSALIVVYVERKRAKTGGAKREAKKKKGRRSVDWLYLVPAGLLLLLALTDLVFHFYSIDPPWRLFREYGMKHLLRHGWLLLTLNLLGSGFTLLVLSAALVILALRRKVSGVGLVAGSVFFGAATLFGAMMVLYLSLFQAASLSQSTGVQKTLENNLESLVPGLGEKARAEAAKRNQKEPQTSDYSAHLLPLLERDIIITGSHLRLHSNDPAAERVAPVPDDLYFYHDYKPKYRCLQAGNQSEVDEAEDPCNPKAPKADARFDMVGNRLLDVIIGSSSIYPVFPSRTLSFGDEPREIRVIDGGFAHNSPIEAAIAWGATHIILVEVSPIIRPQESVKLWDNASIAFNHLYYQAQLVDARVQNKIPIFTLRPEPSTSPSEPDLCTFDFSKDMIRQAITRGLNDASGMRPRFMRSSPEPYFRDLFTETTE